jgi:hypothetical protein
VNSPTGSLIDLILLTGGTMKKLLFILLLSRRRSIITMFRRSSAEILKQVETLRQATPPNTGAAK